MSKSSSRQAVQPAEPLRLWAIAEADGRLLMHADDACCSGNAITWTDRDDAELHSSPTRRVVEFIEVRQPPPRDTKSGDEKARPTSRSLEQRFWPKVTKTPDCWLWTASTDKDGYGQLWSGLDRSSRTMLKAHRVSWEIAHGLIHDGLYVLHRCDNPPCVNPEHLFLGTNRENIDDMNRKKRNLFHRRNPSTKLTDTQVDSLRARRANGERLKSIAEDLGVRESTVSRIANGVRR